MLLIVAGVFALSASAVSATSCTDAGDFVGICNTVIGIANGTLAVISILFTGNNASIIIEAALIVTIVGAILDLSRGKSSWLRSKFERV